MTKLDFFYIERQLVSTKPKINISKLIINIYFK